MRKESRKNQKCSNFPCEQLHFKESHYPVRKFRHAMAKMQYFMKMSVFGAGNPCMKRRAENIPPLLVLEAKNSPTEAEIEAYREAHPHT